MSSPAFSVSISEDTELWIKLISQSPEATIFSDLSYIKSTNCNFRCLIVRKGEQVKAGFIIIEDEARQCIISHEDIVYGGPLFVPDQDMNQASKRAENYNISQAIVDYLVRNYLSICFPFSPNRVDMRPYLWYNYHAINEPIFSPSIRYTSYIDISELRATQVLDSHLFSAMSNLRRRHYKQAIKARAPVILTTNDPTPLLDFYKRLLSDQGKIVSESSLEIKRSIIENLLSSNNGVLAYVKSPDTQEIIYGVFYGIFKSTAYYLYGAGESEHSLPWQGTFAHLSIFKHLAIHRNVVNVDLEGVNSLNRGAFKLSFGGSLTEYFQVKLSRS